MKKTDLSISAAPVPAFVPSRVRSALRPSGAALLLAGSLALAVVGCSSTDDNASKPPAPSSSGSAVSGSSIATNNDPDAQLAQAKTVAVGFFEAQAVNDWAKGLDRSSGAAALTIKWAQAVNNIAAANNTPYQVPSVQSPNVRVQLDALQRTPAGLSTATGFVELSFRPGPVVSTTASSSSTTGAGAPAATFAVDLVFSGEGDAMKLDDYRLDDTPYPVSQLFMAVDLPVQDANGASGAPTLAHRDLDGSVQYVISAKIAGDRPVTFTDSTFTAMATTPGGSTPGSTLRPAVRGTVVADPLKAGGDQSVLVVYPGLFPGSAGALTLQAQVTTTGTSGTTGTTAPGQSTQMRWTLPDLPALTPRPLHTVTPTSTSSTSTSSTTTSSSSSTTTSSTAPSAPSTTVTGPSVTAPSNTVTTVRPTTTTSTSTTSTTNSTTTTLPL